MKGSFWVVLAATAFACGGSSAPPESPASEFAAEETPPAPETGAAETASEPPSDSGASPSEAPQGAAPAEADPPFTENMSVREAVKVVPPGADRANLDPETLGKPLQSLDLYEPCKPGTAKVKLAVAVWNGKAVGVDVTTTPKNDRLSDCIKGKIRELSWDKKVRSLNTVEYQF